MADPLTEAENRFEALSSYQATVRSLAADGERQEIRYFYRKPGWVRMEFIHPHGGMVLIYDPVARRVRLWPFGPRHMLALTLAPDNPLLGNPRGHRIDRSDVGALLENLSSLRARGHLSLLVGTEVAGRSAEGFDVVGDPGATVAGVHRYSVWLARDTLFPLRVESFSLAEKPIETVDMSDAVIDVTFPERLFSP